MENYINELTQSFSDSFQMGMGLALVAAVIGFGYGLCIKLVLKSA